MMNFVAEVQGKLMTDADLIKALRCCSDPWDHCEHPCMRCPVPDERRGVETHDLCDEYIMRLAADRLEELTWVEDG